MRKFLSGAITAASIFGLTGAASAQPAMAPAKQNSCFFISQFQSWKAPDDKTMFIRVGVNKFYRLDMAGSCPALKGISPHLITTFRGGNSVCSRLDWDLKVVRSPGGAPEACIVKEMTALTPEEAAAIPKKFKP